MDSNRGVNAHLRSAIALISADLRNIAPIREIRSASTKDVLSLTEGVHKIKILPEWAGRRAIALVTGVLKIESAARAVGRAQTADWEEAFWIRPSPPGRRTNCVPVGYLHI